MKYNFSTIVLKDLNGKALENQDLHKVLAQAIYVGTEDLDLVPKAIQMNEGKEVEFDKVEIERVKEFINSEKCAIVAFAKKSLLDYIDNTNGKSKTND